MDTTTASHDTQWGPHQIEPGQTATLEWVCVTCLMPIVQIDGTQIWVHIVDLAANGEPLHQVAADNVAAQHKAETKELIDQQLLHNPDGDCTAMSPSPMATDFEPLTQVLYEALIQLNRNLSWKSTWLNEARELRTELNRCVRALRHLANAHELTPAQSNMVDYVIIRASL